MNNEKIMTGMMEDPVIQKLLREIFLEDYQAEPTLQQAELFKDDDQRFVTCLKGSRLARFCFADEDGMVGRSGRPLIGARDISSLTDGELDSLYSVHALTALCLRVLVQASERDRRMARNVVWTLLWPMAKFFDELCGKPLSLSPAAEHVHLSKLESKVAELCNRGDSRKEIASMLKLSVRTIDQAISGVLKKTESRSIVQANYKLMQQCKNADSLVWLRWEELVLSMGRRLATAQIGERPSNPTIRKKPAAKKTSRGRARLLPRNTRRIALRFK